MNKPVKVLIAVVALVAAGISIYFATASRTPGIDLGTYSVLGAVTAEETAKLVSGKGEVLLLCHDTGTYQNPSVEAQVKAFKSALKKSAGLKVTVEKVAVTPMLMLATGGGVPPEQLFKALKAHANLAALVLFCRFPQLPEADLDEFKKYNLKTVVVSSFYPDYKRLLDRQLLHLAIVPRPEAAAASNAKTVRERFDQEFMLIDAARAQTK